MYIWVVDTLSSFSVVYTPPRLHNIPLYIFTPFLSCHIDLEDIYPRYVQDHGRLDWPSPQSFDAFTLLSLSLSHSLFLSLPLPLPLPPPLSPSLSLSLPFPLTLALALPPSHPVDGLARELASLVLASARPVLGSTCPLKTSIHLHALALSRG